nr:uncharacterized protein LOC127328457 [Lolium perenne]
MLRQPRHPPTHATTVTQPPPPSHRDPLTKTDETGRKHPEPRGAWTAATREDATSTASCGDGPDARTRSKPGPFGPAEPDGLVKLPWPHCSPRAAVVATLSGESPPAAGSRPRMPDPARPSLDGARAGPDPGRNRAARAAADLHAAPPPRGCADAATSPRRRRLPAGAQQPPEPCPPRCTVASSGRSRVSRLARG